MAGWGGLLIVLMGVILGVAQERGNIGAQEFETSPITVCLAMKYFIHSLAIWSVSFLYIDPLQSVHVSVNYLTLAQSTEISAGNH